MPDDFEWQTDVDDVWVEAEPDASRTVRNIDRRVKLLAATVLICTLVSGAAWIYLSLNKRVKVATETARSDVLETHDLLVNAALRGDTDVVHSLTVDRPSSWWSLQAELLSKRLFFGRRPLAIDPVVADVQRVAEISLIHLSPDLITAEVRDRRPYVVQSSARTTGTVILERSFLYEHSDNQWLLSPPSDDRAYWGTWEHAERNILTVTFPERDEEIAIWLAGEIDTLLADLCTLHTVACPSGFRLNLRLETDPTSLRRLGELPHTFRASSSATENRISLPAPSLIGRPVDEAGLRALQRGYAGWIAAAVVAGYSLQEDAADPDSTADVLAELGLRMPPAPLQPLPKSSLAGFPAEASRPQQDVLMLCAGQDSARLLRLHTGSGRWQEEVPSDQWRKMAQLATEQGFYLSRLPDYSAALIQIGDYGSTWRTYMWQDGSLRLLAEDSFPYLYLPPNLQAPNQPVDNYLFFYVPVMDDGSQRASGLRLDMNRCLRGPCSLERLEGLPVRSPDGRQSVVYVPRDHGGHDLYLGDEAGEIEHVIGAVSYELRLGDDGGEASELIGPGQSVAWLDEASFSYVAVEPGIEVDRLGRRFGRQIMIADTRGKFSPALLIGAEFVRRRIPESIRPDSLGLWSARPVVKGDPKWIISATSLDSADERDYLIVIDPQTGQVTLAADLGHFQLFQPPVVSPKGRYAVVAGISAESNDINVELVNVATGEMRRLEPSIPTDWSRDDAWLLSAESGTLYLVWTATGQEWPIAHDLPGCQFAIWTDR